jgi:hypothetical protein
MRTEDELVKEWFDLGRETSGRLPKGLEPAGDAVSDRERERAALCVASKPTCATVVSCSSFATAGLNQDESRVLEQRDHEFCNDPDEIFKEALEHYRGLERLPIGTNVPFRREGSSPVTRVGPRV